MSGHVCFPQQCEHCEEGRVDERHPGNRFHIIGRMDCPECLGTGFVICSSPYCRDAAEGLDEHGKPVCCTHLSGAGVLA